MRHSFTPLFLSALLSLPSPSLGAFDRRGDPTDTSAPSTVSGTDVTQNGGAVAITQQLKSDVTSAVSAFSDAIAANSNNPDAQKTAQLFQDITNNMLKYPLNQNVGSTPTMTEDKLKSMASAVESAMDNIEDVANSYLQDTNGAVQFQDLKNCIGQLTAQGGLQDGQSCVTKNGMSITAVSSLMSNVLDGVSSVIPSDILQQTVDAVDPHFTALMPAEQDFATHISNAFQSVQASINGALVQALDSAQQCFQQGMQSSDYQAAQAAIDACNEDSTNSKSVYSSMKTLDLSIANQFVGYLTPNLLDDIHNIADQYNSNPPPAGSDAQYFRNAIRASTDSIVASDAGNQVTYAYKIANCLDTVASLPDVASAVSTAQTSNCLDAPDGPKASQEQVVNGYIQQVYGVLPPQLAARIESSGVAKLDPTAPDYAQQVSALHQQFMQTDPGPEYVTCYEKFEDCLFNKGYGALVNPNTQQTCLLGPACQAQPDGSANPTISRRGSSISWSLTSWLHKRHYKTFFRKVWDSRHSSVRTRSAVRSKRARHANNRFKRSFASGSRAEM